MRWFSKKGICSLRFVWNQSLSLKRDELRLWIESSFFSWGAKTNGLISLGYTILMHWFYEKSIFSLCFVWNQSLSLKRDELRLWIECSFLKPTSSNSSFKIAIRPKYSLEVQSAIFWKKTPKCSKLFFLSSRTAQNHWNSPRSSRIDIIHGFSSRFNPLIQISSQIFNIYPVLA